MKKLLNPVGIVGLMFNSLQKRFSQALSKVRGLSRISEKEVDAVLAEVRTGLLEADVHFRVAKDFLARVKERCLREEVIQSLSPETQIVKVLSDELTQILGGVNRELNFAVKPPAVVLMCGLQGAGKTTTTVKLALLLKSQFKKNPAVVSVDVSRPAAITQLQQLALRHDIAFIESQGNEKPLDIAKRAMKSAQETNVDVLLVDTAGRLQIDADLMGELSALKTFLQPSEILLVLDSMIGQQAVEVAEGFDKDIGITGSILSKLDGDTRGGAALSLVAVTGKPIKFIGTGERATDLEPFFPDRMSSRLLDMGDLLSLVEKAQRVISHEDAEKAADKLRSNDFSLEDFRDQLRMISKMGPIGGILKMLPGLGSLSESLDNDAAEKELKRVNAILDSMTTLERRSPDILNGGRRSRIAKGSGTQVSDVNQLIKRFSEARKMMKQMGKMAGLFRGAGGAGAPGNAGSASLPTGGVNMPPGLFGKRPSKGFGRKF